MAAVVAASNNAILTREQNAIGCRLYLLLFSLTAEVGERPKIYLARQLGAALYHRCRVRECVVKSIVLCHLQCGLVYACKSLFIPHNN